MIYFLILCLCYVTINGQENPQVKISDGKLEGKILKTKEGREFSAFQGIPYAEPPLGQLRFKSPVPNKPWQGTLDATLVHAMCPQSDVFGKTEAIFGVEDCLFLNVYTPKLPSENNDLLPVMVFLHGGGFYLGSGNSFWYGPEVLLDRDIVLVSINYRLGALGFLSTGDDVSPGNYGLKDQSLALKWVSKNIKYFGGDPKSVTIFGESAGAASVNYQMLSPLSKGLFKGAISQSGTSFCLWAHNAEDENSRNARKLAEAVGCPTSSSRELIQCLTNVDVVELLKQDKLFVVSEFDLQIPFKPVVESPSPDAFLTDTPTNLFKAGKFHDVPWIVGTTLDEGLLMASAFSGAPELFKKLSQNFKHTDSISLMLQSSLENSDEVIERIREFYFGDKEELTMENAFTSLVDMYTDGWFIKAIDDPVRIHLKVAKKPVYNYLFAHKSGASFSQILGDPGKIHGVCHADDLQYLFPLTDTLFPYKNITEDDKKVTKVLTTLWENFAKTGNPTPETNDLITAKWEPIKSEKLEYYHIDAKEQGMRDALFEKRVNFWRSLRFEPKKGVKREEL